MVCGESSTCASAVPTTTKLNYQLGLRATLPMALGEAGAMIQMEAVASAGEIAAAAAAAVAGRLFNDECTD